MALKVTFCGGAETVTGSNFLIESDSGKMLVDCGIEQGRDFVAKDVYGPFPYDPASINAIVFTHAHLDHVGRAPKLVKDGFRGKAYMTPPTRDLAELILKDSVDILAQEAARLHHDPLYSAEDVDRFLSLIEPLDYHEEKIVAPGLSVYLRTTGHILGSASVRIKSDDDSTVAFTGDIGNSPSPYLPDPEPIPDASAIFMESVYGDRVHEGKDDRVALMRDAVLAAIKRGGAILMPAFSMERTQLMLYELHQMFEKKELPQIPVFLDSPLAIAVTDVYKKYEHTEYFQSTTTNLFNFPFLTKTPSRQESMEIDKVLNPKLIMAGAGMSHGGRIGRHEIKYLPDPSTTLFIVGYQAPGSPGRLLQSAVPKVRIDNTDVNLRAKVVTLSAWSAHADRDELLAFADGCIKGGQVKQIFVGLGEPSSARFLAQRIHDYLGMKAVVPVAAERWEISKDSLTHI